MILNKANHALLVPFDKVKNLWPEDYAYTIQQNGTTYAVLPHNPRTQIKLRAAGIEAPPPILYYYDWESSNGEVPFAIQKKTAATATSYQRAYILNDLGTGKTRSALWSWHYLHQAGMAKKLLVVAPLSTLRFVWLKEIQTLMPHLNVVVLHSTDPRKRRELLNTKADIFVINHDGLKVIANELYEREDIDCLILDELAVYRNRSKRTLLMERFAQRFVWVWGMTGRPMPNAVTDVFYQAKILTPQNVPKYFRHAQSMLMVQIDQYNWRPKPDAVEKALAWMQPSVRFSLDDVVELPEAIYRTIQVELTDEQKKVYARLANEFAVMIREQKVTAANAGVALGKLLQVGCGYVYSMNPQYVALDSAPRQDVLLEIIEESNDKLIVCAPWRHLIDNLSNLLTENEIDHAMVHGDTKKREKVFDAFQNTTQYKVLLVHPQTISHGLTLTAAKTVVWYSPVTSLDIYDQLNARVRRVGQGSKQLYLHLCSTPVEQKVYSMLKAKARLQDTFLAMIKEAVNGERTSTGFAQD